MEMTPRPKKVGFITEAGKYAGIAIACLTLTGLLTVKAQNIIVLPVVKKEVDAAKQECKDEMSKTHTELSDALKEQAAINREMLDFLHKLDITTTELKTETRIMNRRRAE